MQVIRVSNAPIVCLRGSQSKVLGDKDSVRIVASGLRWTYRQDMKWVDISDGPGGVRGPEISSSQSAMVERFFQVDSRPYL